MNSTKWITLTAFLKYLSEIGKIIVDETDRGWFIKINFTVLYLGIAIYNTFGVS